MHKLRLRFGYISLRLAKLNNVVLYLNDHKVERQIGSCGLLTTNQNAGWSLAGYGSKSGLAVAQDLVLATEEKEISAKFLPHLIMSTCATLMPGTCREGFACTYAFSISRE